MYDDAIGIKCMETMTTIFTRVLVELVYKLTPHFQDQKSDFSSCWLKK